MKFIFLTVGINLILFSSAPNSEELWILSRGRHLDLPAITSVRLDHLSSCGYGSSVPEDSTKLVGRIKDVLLIQSVFL